MFVWPIVLGVVLARAFRGHFAAERHRAVPNAVLYRHVVDAAWLVVFTSLYVAPFVRQPVAQNVAAQGSSQTTAQQHPAPARHRPSSFTPWFGLAGAPLAWSVQTLVNLPISSHACFPRLSPCR